MLAWVWAKLFGGSEAGLRSLSALIGTATIPVAWLAAEPFVRARGRAILAVLVAASPFLVWYSQEARAYALLVLLGALTMLFFGRALREDRQQGRWLALWAISAAAAIATHYFAAFLVVSEAAWYVWRRGVDRRALLAGLGVLAVAAALLPLAIAQRGNKGASGVGEASLSGRVEQVPKKFLVAEYGGPVRGLAPLGLALVAVGLALLAARTAREERASAAIPLALAAITFAIPFLAALVGLDYLTPRYLSVAWIPFFAAAAAGFGASRAGWVGSAAALVLTAVFATVSIAIPLTPRLQRDDWRGAAKALGPRSGARAIVLSPTVGFVPFKVYRPAIEAPPGGRFAVREVDVIVMKRPGRDVAIASPASRFRQVFRKSAATYAAVRFISPEPRVVAIRELLARRFTADPVGLVYEP